jgi:hypothetical protein
MKQLTVAISARKMGRNKVPNFSEPHIAIDLTVSIDGRILVNTDGDVGDDVILDGYTLLETLHPSKFHQFQPEYFFFTCECGEPGCAGLFDGVVVTRLEQTVVWRFPDAYGPLLRARGFGNVRIFEFERAAYDSALQRIYNFVRRAEAWVKLPACVGSTLHYSENAFPTGANRWLFGAN